MVKNSSISITPSPLASTALTIFWQSCRLHLSPSLRNNSYTSSSNVRNAVFRIVFIWQKFLIEQDLFYKKESIISLLCAYLFGWEDMGLVVVGKDDVNIRRWNVERKINEIIINSIGLGSGVSDELIV